MNTLPELGARLRAARKRGYPNDDLATFALRIGVSRATLQKMEKGDMSVAIGRYLAAAKRLGLSDGFDALFAQSGSMFDD